LETEDVNEYEYILNRIQSMHESKENSKEELPDAGIKSSN
jgi:hypothetical protein